MTIDTQSIDAKINDQSIPQWVKFAITFVALSIGIIFVRSVLSAQQALFGLSTQSILVISLGLVLLFAFVVAAFWFFPGSPFTQFLYWSIRFFKDQIWLLALIGIVYLITVRAPLFSFRGGIPLINLTLLFFIGLFVQPVSAVDAPFSRIKKLSSSWARFIDRINSQPTWLLSVIVGLLPILVICWVIYFGLGARLSDYGPYSFWNDETGYWVWIRSFSQVGLDVGYNAPNELIARASFNHYGEGSPLYIYIYGAIAQLAGWTSYLPLLINFVLLALAIFIFVRSTKLQPVQIIFVGLITLLTWPILLYLPMTTHETLNQVIGILLAILFFRFLTDREQVNVPARIAFIVLVFIAALTRLSWGLLLVPVLFYSLNGSILRRVFLSVLLGAGLYISAVLITNYLVPPTNNSILVNLTDSFAVGPQVLIKYIATQFRLMFKFRQLNPNIAVMLQIAIILGWSLVRLIRMIRAKLSAASILQSRNVFDMYNVASLAAAGLLFYIQEGFYRTFTPSLIIVYLLHVTRKDYRPLVALLTINLVFFYSYMTFYARVGDAAIIRSDFTTEFSDSARLQSKLGKWIVFDETAQNPWCNTLLIPLYFYDSRLTVIPAGIGISYVYNADTMETPIKSKYLLFDHETYGAFADRLNATDLESLPIGDLYYNQDSGCELKP